MKNNRKLGRKRIPKTQRGLSTSMDLRISLINPITAIRKRIQVRTVTITFG
jgi:hypothetical protein